MAVPNDITIADTLVTQGYFDKVRTGDQRAASYFARLFAFTANPSGQTTSWGWLRKGGGTQVEGYAEDAVVYGADPSDVQNVVDLVIGAGAPGARLISNTSGTVPRRPTDVWEAPRALTSMQLDYLKPGGVVIHPPPPPPPPPPVRFDRGEMFDALTFLNTYYKAPEGLQRPQGLSINGAADLEGVAAWMFDVYVNARLDRKSHQAGKDAMVAEIRKSGEWQSKHPGETP